MQATQMLNKADISDDCSPGEQEEDCLVRRELVAHTDYIYTQSQNP